MYLRAIGRGFAQMIAYFLVMNSKRCKNSHPITVDNVMLLLYMYMYMRLLRGAGGMNVPGQVSNRVILCFEE